jgi:hypothetical protein
MPTLREVDDETEGVIRKIRDIAKQGVETPSRRGEICRDDLQYEASISLTELTVHDRLIFQPGCPSL